MHHRQKNLDTAPKEIYVTAAETIAPQSLLTAGGTRVARDGGILRPKADSAPGLTLQNAVK